MNLEKAKHLLEMLRCRTEARGATPAEAAQAAALAEAIIQRYELDDPAQRKTDHAAGVELREKRFPRWADTLSLAIRMRFKVAAVARYGGDKPAAGIFRGPEHAVRVAVWLYAAIAKDIDSQAHWQARVLGRSGPRLVKFRNEFRDAAAWEIYKRLNPEDYRRVTAGIEAMQEELANQPCKPLSKTDLKRITNVDSEARQQGQKAGRQIAIDTNVLPDEAPRPVALLGAK